MIGTGTRWGLAIVAIFMAGGLSCADDLSDFNDAVEAFAAHNRTAIGYLRTENADLAALELDRMQDAWSALAARFGKNRPAPFRDNALYATMLVDVPARIVSASIMLNSGRLALARAALQAVRQEISAVRRASGIEVLADCVLDANAAMDALFVYRDHPPDWTRPDTAADISERANHYSNIIKRCEALAAPQMRADPEFRRLIDGALASLAFVPKAVATKDSGLLHRVLIELRAFDNLLAFRYG